MVTLFRFGLGCFLLCVLQSVNAQVGTSHGHHQEISVSESLTFGQVLQSAIDRSPQRDMGGAYRRYAEGQSQIGERLIVGNPRLNMSYQDDEVLDGSGLMEMEAGVEFDLWRRGQKDNARQLANSLSQSSEAWQDYFYWSVAGSVRIALHGLVEAEVRSEHAALALDDANTLLRTSESLLKAGVISRRELLQIESLVLDSRQHLLAQQANLVDVERSYYQLTGLLQRPATFAEFPVQSPGISAEHPQLQFLQAQLQQQSNMVERERFASGENISVSFGVRRERGSDLDPEIDSLGLAVSIPFNTGANRNARVSEASVAKTEASVRFEQAHRQLTAQLHEAEHELDVVNDSINIAKASVELLKEQWSMTEKAFSLGESDIQPTIRALQKYRESLLQLRLLEIQHTALISTLKQTVGVLP